MAMAREPEVRPIMQQLRNYIADNPVDGWDKAWKSNVTPWDNGQGQPPLRDLILSGEIDLPREGKALVPGCGKGYDAVFIASELGLETLAVDISPTAVEAAKKSLSSSPRESSAKVTFEIVDFFTMNPTEPFDLVYDYTFFVAILPSLRPDWGAKMRELVKPGGYLVTLVFPLDPPTNYGPPFFVRPEHYTECLGEGWEIVLDRIPAVSQESHVDRERLVVRRRLD